MVLYLMALTDL